MTDAIQVEQRIISLFAEQPCWMIEPLAAQLRYSIPSVRRFLVQTAYHSSFTHNGGWYTLRSIPQFNKDDLWFYNDIGFSKIGSLTSTLTHLAQRSPSGLTAEQLGEIMCCRWSFHIGSVMPTGQTSATEDGAITCLSGYRSRNLDYPASVHADFTCSSTACGNCSTDSGGVYPQATIQLCGFVRNHFAQKACYGQCGDDPKPLRKAWSKKTIQTVGPRPGRH